LDDCYYHHRKWHGTEGGRLAYESHTEAIHLIEKIIADENISCDFSRVDGYLFLGPEHDESYLEDELQAAHAVGFTDVALLNRAPASFFESGPCLHFPQQAQFDPLKYLKGLARAIKNLGGEIYMQTRVVDVKGGPHAVIKTAGGYDINCEHIVVATNVPINDLVTMHTKEAAYRSYVIGIRVPVGHIVPALFWDTTSPYHFVRMHFLPDQDYDVLIVGGEDHRVGQCEHPEKQFLKLKEWAMLRLGISPDVVYQWSGQIIEPIDGLAYIGRNPGDEENVFIATGDSGHGITHGTIAGQILRDLITNQENKFASLYNPSRFNWKCLGTFARENFMGAAQYTDWLSIDEKERNREDLAPGQGAILSEGIHKYAVYRDLEGQFHEFSAACPHLKGVVRWNATEQTWDCPLHGSRFSSRGEALNGPALTGLVPKDHIALKVPEKKKIEKDRDITTTL
jgi:glycine/D-amino acid oxidase-like deaminating enzyme/nitrite reductase/ring-hydroxylating ferredoxin subunit